MADEHWTDDQGARGTPQPSGPAQPVGWQQPGWQQPTWQQPGWQQPPAPGYGPPAGYPAYPWAPQRTNGMAVASMVLGILWIYWIGSILALVFGYIARSQIRERGEGGSGMAVAGIVLGWVGLGILLLIVVVAAAARTGF
jgi:Domain of unknown function (DUF4190)